MFIKSTTPCTYIQTNIHTYIHIHMYVYTDMQRDIHSELGECMLCFPDNRRQFGATGSDLGNGMRKFVKAKKDFNIHRAT